VGLARLDLAAGRAAAAAERMEGLLARRPDEPALLLALADIYTSAPHGPTRRPEDALLLLDRLKALYGEDVAVRVRALAAAGRTSEAEGLAAESPFLGKEERSAVQALAK
jgi:predicted Zn-dependent protease